ncbi:MAG: flagellar protein FliS [Acidobacteriota bacterium]
MDRYLESEVLNADPVKLVSLLYRGALDAIAAARAALHAGKVTGAFEANYQSVGNCR